MIRRVLIIALFLNDDGIIEMCTVYCFIFTTSGI